MKEVRVIDRKCLPTNFRFLWVIVYWLLLDRFEAPGWAYGVLWTLFAIYTLTAFAVIWNQKLVKLTGFGGDD